MSPPGPPVLPALLLCGATYREASAFDEALSRMEARFGPAARVGDPFSFHHTRYYEAEMGRNLLKRLVVFRAPVHAGFLARAKRLTGGIEETLRAALPAGRRVNLDPGTLSRASLVLASTKPAAHRIYLGLGIYGEVTLMYHSGGYAPLPWTYPDFLEPGVLSLLGETRRELLLGRQEGVR